MVSLYHLPHALLSITGSSTCCSTAPSPVPGIDEGDSGYDDNDDDVDDNANDTDYDNMKYKRLTARGHVKTRNGCL